ncbi:uncharacterized protein RSE6_09501 [Rhynchosporium secalis]|uniref:Uncharacterized protein n=1 Tax=Rhynchosporium secalis TaxID=38038 RepID=A0A1E1MI74_RHYSE|nr:uncharacterized protein RSE6_09501 [Rhynchosporium secalis]
MGSARVTAEATAKYTAKNSAKRKKSTQTPKISAIELGKRRVRRIRRTALKRKAADDQGGVSESDRNLRSTRKKAANKNDKADPFPKYGTFTTTKTTWTMARRIPYE